MEGRVEWKMDKTVKSQAATSGTEDSSTTLWPPLSLWYGAIWIPWKSASRPRVSQQSAATRRADSSADGCYSYGLDGNIWIPGGRPFMALFLWRMAECLSSCHPAGLPRSGARFNVWGLRLGENGRPIRGMELDFWPRAGCLRFLNGICDKIRV